MINVLTKLNFALFSLGYLPWNSLLFKEEFLKSLTAGWALKLVSCMHPTWTTWMKLNAFSNGDGALNCNSFKQKSKLAFIRDESFFCDQISPFVKLAMHFKIKMQDEIFLETCVASIYRRFATGYLSRWRQGPVTDPSANCWERLVWEQTWHQNGISHTFSDKLPVIKPTQTGISTHAM